MIVLVAQQRSATRARRRTAFPFYNPGARGEGTVGSA